MKNSIQISITKTLLDGLDLDLHTVISTRWASQATGSDIQTIGQQQDKIDMEQIRYTGRVKKSTWPYPNKNKQVNTIKQPTKHHPNDW
jgi:hypothetical protein